MKMQGGDLFDRIMSIENIRDAHSKASKGKSHYTEVKWVNANERLALEYIQYLLHDNTFTTADYVVEEAMKGDKMRTIHKLPYFPDRIIQHAIVNICSPVWINSMIRDTFQSIPGRGPIDCFRRVRSAVQDDKPLYGIKLDITKFYPSVRNVHLLNPRTFRIKCPRTLLILKDIICSLDGLPLGNHTSQYGGNLVLTPVDWYAKQQLNLKHYFRYCDDIVVLSDSKEELLAARTAIQHKLAQIDLKIKPHVNILNLSEEALDFVGYRISHGKVEIRKRMASRFKTASGKGNIKALPSYYGWCKHANALNLYHKLATKAERKWKLRQKKDSLNIKD